jgi:hypothetical protein
MTNVGIAQLFLLAELNSVLFLVERVVCLAH